MKKDKQKRTAETPEHLGGHNFRTWVDEGVLSYFVKNHGVKSFLDIGAGPGDMIEFAKQYGLFALGVDGDPIFKDREDTQLHDYTVGPLGRSNIQKLPEQGYYDLGWSVEFLEHVEEKYIPNFMETFKLCKYLVVTAATPKQGGHHHVNEQWVDYWIKIFAEHGFKISGKLTQDIRACSTMRRKMVDFSYEFVDDEVVCHKVKKSFMEKNGWVFINQAYK